MSLYAFCRFVDDIADGLFIYNGHGQFTDVNQQACLSLGYSREEVRGRPLSNFLTESSAED